MTQAPTAQDVLAKIKARAFAMDEAKRLAQGTAGFPHELPIACRTDLRGNEYVFDDRNVQTIKQMFAGKVVFAPGTAGHPLSAWFMDEDDRETCRLGGFHQ